MESIAEQLGVGRGTAERAYRSLSQEPSARQPTPNSYNLPGPAAHVGPFSQSSVIGKALRVVDGNGGLGTSCHFYAVLQDLIALVEPMFAAGSLNQSHTLVFFAPKNVYKSTSNPVTRVYISNAKRA